MTARGVWLTLGCNGAGPLSFRPQRRVQLDDTMLFGAEWRNPDDVSSAMLLQGIQPKQPGENALMLHLRCGHSRDLSTTRPSPASCLRFPGAPLEMTDAHRSASLRVRDVVG